MGLNRCSLLLVNSTDFIYLTDFIDALEMCLMCKLHVIRIIMRYINPSCVNS